MPGNNEAPETTVGDGHLSNEPTEPTAGGKFDAGEDGEDGDIVGKDQGDLTAEDLKGDSRAK